MKFPLFLIVISFLSSCNGGGNPSPDSAIAEDYFKFTVSTEDFINPERGFYKYSEARSSSYSNLSVATLKRNRGATFSSNSSYESYNSLVFRYFVLGDFVNSPISEEYLTEMQDDFDAAREAGVKVIPRFTYTTSATSGDCAEGFICPPYGDATKERILAHIQQVGPILTENVDVILTVQMGWIGTWGENYYTDYFGDASPNADQGKVLDENWTDRIEVLKALLDAIPKELTVQVRYPQIKQRAVYGIDAKTNVAPLTESEAYDGSYNARIAHHNDCLFASAADFGTYEDYGSSTTPRRTDIPNLKPYFANDSKYAVVGGETCFDGYSPQNDCAPLGMADDDLRLLHYTYLNADYNNEVNNDWVDGGCMEAIKQNLGYRIILDSALIPSSVSLPEGLSIKMNFTNVGYAAPVSFKPVILVLISEDGTNEYRYELDTDIRFWHDSIEIDQSLSLADGIEEGNYDLSIFIPDNHESIADRPEYAIRLANADMWNETNGYNDLGMKLAIIQ